MYPHWIRDTNSTAIGLSLLFHKKLGFKYTKAKLSFQKNSMPVLEVWTLYGYIMSAYPEQTIL
jgi:hypothetical protein